MKIIDAINRIDSLKHNTFTQSDKVEWLSRLDAMVKKHIIDTHEGDEVDFTGYDDSTDLQTELLIPEPYAEVYLRWMEAQIDYYNGEYDKYNNAIDMFNTAYNGYQNYYNRTHMPKGKKYKHFGGENTSALPGKPNSGTDGITPHIGPNGNWFIGETDTGMPSRGEPGPQGVSGVYVGPGEIPEGYNIQIDPTGEAPVLVQSVNGVKPDKNGNVEVPTAPDSEYTLPIATPDTLGGVKPVAKTEDMTQPVGVDELGGLWSVSGGGKWKKVRDDTTTEDVTEIAITNDIDFSQMFISIHAVANDADNTLTTGDTSVRIIVANGLETVRAIYSSALLYTRTTEKYPCYIAIEKKGKYFEIVSYRNIGYQSAGWTDIGQATVDLQAIDTVHFYVIDTGKYIKAGARIEVWVK